MVKYFKACASRPLRSGGLSPEQFTTRKSIVCNLPFLSHTRVTWPFGFIVWPPYAPILLFVLEIFTFGNSCFSNELGMVLQVEAESIWALTVFDCPPWIRCKWAKNFFAPIGFAWQFTTNASSVGSSLTKFDCSCRLRPVRVPPLHARAKWPMIPHLLHRFPNAGQCCWPGLGQSPRHQKQAAVKVSELRFSGVVFFVKFTCSYWMPQAFFINWFANAVASWLLATSTTSRRVTFDCALSRRLCPFPISFTRRGSEVNPAINWSLINLSAKFSYSHWAAWLRILVSQDAMDSSSFSSKERNFCLSPETPMLAP